MSPARGRLRWADLGAGGWEVELPDGRRRALVGPPPPGARDGDEVDWVDAEPSYGFLLTGAPGVRVVDRRRG